MTPVILWDIDGTLVGIPPSKQDKHAAAIEHVLHRRPPKDESWSGRTDGEILAAMVDSVSVPLTADLLKQLIDVLNQITAAELAQHPLEPTPGCASTLIELRARGFRNGVITGNTRTRAELKLRSAGIFELVDFDLGFFGESTQDRALLVGSAVVSLRRQSGLRLVALIGDTPNDIRAGHTHSIPVIAVATGNYTFEALLTFNADFTLDSLAYRHETFDLLVR